MICRYWNEFNPYFLHFTQADFNAATENYHVAIKGKPVTRMMSQ
jgi:hypothetical protein